MQLLAKVDQYTGSFSQLSIARHLVLKLSPLFIFPEQVILKYLYSLITIRTLNSIQQIGLFSNRLIVHLSECHGVFEYLIY